MARTFIKIGPPVMEGVELHIPITRVSLFLLTQEVFKEVFKKKEYPVMLNITLEMHFEYQSYLSYITKSTFFFSYFLKEISFRNTFQSANDTLEYGIILRYTYVISRKLFCNSTKKIYTSI